MLVTNFSNPQLGRYQKAIIEFKEKTSINTLIIVPMAFDVFDHRVVDNSALHNSQPCDLSEFWKIYDNL